ncbi:MAG TPA: GGDEF domain-containing protein [Thermoleophilaceae bacterium]|nr:GGDEF domain-containing protein [Thermoleophilaceae bacterium]
MEIERMSIINRWPSRLARYAAPAQVHALALLWIGLGALALAGAALAGESGPERVEGAIDGCLAIAGGALCRMLAARFRIWTLQLATVVTIVSASLTLTEATTPPAAALALAGVLWTGAYVGSFHAPRAARLHAACLWLGPTAVLLAAGAHDALMLWIAFGGPLTITIEVLSRIGTRLRRDAITDPLTGLHNRNGLREAARRALAASRRSSVALTVAQIDLDGFKEVNDRFGHLEGDRMLQLCADTWRSEIRAEDILARVGGDEFVLVMVGSDRPAATSLLERLRVSSPIGWSYGVAELGPGDDLASCLARADEELYAAKAGRGAPSRGDAQGAPALLLGR